MCRTALAYLAVLAAHLTLFLPGVARATDADGNDIDDQAEVALALRFRPVLALHGPDTALHSNTVPVYPVPVEIMGLGGAEPGEGLPADRLFVLWRQQPNDYPYGDHWVRATGWAPPLPESDPAHDYSSLRDDPPERRTTAPPAQPSGIYTLRFHWEYGNPAINEPEEWYEVWENGNAWTRPGSAFPPTAYAHLVRCATAGCGGFGPGATLVQYWCFFPFNDWVNNHEGDWEGINVIASSDDPQTSALLDVEYFAHKVNFVRSLGVPLSEHCQVLDGTHPVAFIGGHGRVEGCTGGTGEGEASHGFYPTAGRFEAMGEGDFLGCFDPADEEVAVSAGPTIHWSDIEVQVLQDPAAIDTAAEPARAWLAADLLWGTRRVPSVGGNLSEDVGNYAPHGPAYNLEGRWGRVSAGTATRAYSRSGDPHPRPYQPADLGWVPFAFFLDPFTGATENETGDLSDWTLGTGSWSLAGGGLVGAGDGAPSRTNRAFFRSTWPPTWFRLPFATWNERAARFAADVTLLAPLAEGDAAGVLVAGADGSGGEDQVAVVLRQTAGSGHAVEIRVRGLTTDSLIASAPIADPGAHTHRLEALTLAPESGGLFHDVWYDGALVLESVATTGARADARGLIADGTARARFDRISFSGLRLEPEFRHPPFAAFTVAPGPGADIYACSQRVAWTAADEKGAAWIAAQEVALSTNGGIGWQVLARLDGQTRSFNWLPPEVSGERPARLRLSVTDLEGDRRVITSPGFWLVPGTAPAAILAPSGGEEWRRSTAATIRWSAPCRGPVELALSIDGGASFPHVIASGEPNDGALTWMIPGYLPAGSRCRVRIADGALPPAESQGDFTIVWDGELAGGDFEHTEPWSLVPVVARALGSSSYAHGIGQPPLGPPLSGQASLFAHTQATGDGARVAAALSDASWPARSEIQLVAESEPIPASNPSQVRALHFQLKVQANADEEEPYSQASASATLRLEAAYQDASGQELTNEEIASVTVFRTTPGSTEDARDDVALIPWPPAEATELRIRLRLETSSEALSSGALAEAQAMADELWFAVPVAVSNLNPAARPTSLEIHVAPNPARPGRPVRVRFNLAAPGPVTLALYDVRGGLATRLLERSARPAGQNEIRWDPEGLPAGVYFWRLESAAGSQVTAKWMIAR